MKMMVFCSFSGQRLKPPVLSTGWSLPRPRGPIHQAVYTVSTTSSLLIFLLNISCPCPTRRITQLNRLRRKPFSNRQQWLIQAMAFLDCYAASSGNENCKITNWPGKYNLKKTRFSLMPLNYSPPPSLPNSQPPTREASPAPMILGQNARTPPPKRWKRSFDMAHPVRKDSSHDQPLSLVRLFKNSFRLPKSRYLSFLIDC